MCMCTGKSNPATSPTRSTIFANPDLVNGAPRSVTNTCRPSGQSGRNCRSARTSVTTERVRRWHAVLLPAYVNQSGAKVDLVPAQLTQFRHFEPVTGGHSDRQRVAMTVPTTAPRCLSKRLDLGWRQVLALTHLYVLRPTDTPTVFRHCPQNYVSGSSVGPIGRCPAQSSAYQAAICAS